MVKAVIINLSVLISLVVLIEGTFSAAQNADYVLSNDIIDQEITTPPLICPSLSKSYCYCSVDHATNSLTLRCRADSSSTIFPEDVQTNLRRLKELGPISSLLIYDIEPEYFFNYVPNDFLTGNSIPSVTFSCSSSYAYKPPLAFGIDAFRDTSTGICGLTRNLTFNDCNLRQFDGDILNGCNQMTNLGFLNCHVEALNRFPQLESLTNLTVYYGKYWNGASQRGLVNFPVTADQVPRLSYLDLTGHMLLQGDDVNILIPQLLQLEQLYLEGNNFSNVPDLTNLFYLDIFTILLNDTLPEVSIRLPNPRKTALPSLQASVKTSLRETKRLKEFTGDLYNAMITLDIKMNGTFEQSVFQAPLESLSSTGQLIIDTQSRFDCQCSIAWLVRDRPRLIDRIRSGGICEDGRQFSEIQADELAGCPST